MMKTYTRECADDTNTHAFLINTTQCSYMHEYMLAHRDNLRYQVGNLGDTDLSRYLTTALYAPLAKLYITAYCMIEQERQRREREDGEGEERRCSSGNIGFLTLKGNIGHVPTALNVVFASRQISARTNTTPVSKLGIYYSQ